MLLILFQTLPAVAGFTLALLRGFKLSGRCRLDLARFNGIHRGGKRDILQLSILAKTVEVADDLSGCFDFDGLSDLEEFAWQFNLGGEPPRKKEREKKKSGGGI